MKQLLILSLLISVLYIDMVDDTKDPKVSYVVVTYDNGAVDKMRFPREKLLEGKSEEIKNAAMQMIRARLGK